MTPWNPLPDWLTSWKRVENSRDQEARQSLTPWWCPNVSQFWNRRGCSTTAYASGDNHLPTSKRGRSTSFFFTECTERRKYRNKRRKRGVHRHGAKHLRCTTSPSRREPWDDRRHPNDFSGDVRTELRAERTGTSQCSPYQIKLRGNGTVVTDYFDHEQNTGAFKNICL